MAGNRIESSAVTMKLFTSGTASAAAALLTAATLRCFHRRLAAPQTTPRTLFDVTQARYAESRRRWGERALQQLDSRSPPNTSRVGNVGEGGVGQEGSGEVAGYPPLRRSTVMFLHIFKCAGSTLR